MIENKKIVVIIPARGGSTRLKRKNIYEIWNKPMIYWVIRSCKDSKYIDDIYVSSEDEEILNISKKYDVNTIKRPQELADNLTYKHEVIHHTLKNIENKYDIVISVQPNSPELCSIDLDRAIEKLVSDNRNEIMSVDEITFNGNAAFRIFDYNYALNHNKGPSVKFGVFKTNYFDIHTIEDVNYVENNRCPSLNYKIDNKRSVYIIAELSNQFGGNLEKAEQMILQCKMAGASAVKIQLWDAYRRNFTQEQIIKKDYLSLSYDNFKKICKYANTLNIEIFASVFHKDRLKWICDENFNTIKIASRTVKEDIDLCEEIINTGKQIYCSLGMWDKDKLPFNNPNVKYFHCVSKYPHSYEEALEHMPEKFDSKIIGYSDHSIGIDACKESIKRGAKIIEKHFTLDKNFNSNTEGAHKCSMDYQDLLELRKFCDKNI
jgi:hypothetical protein